MREDTSSPQPMTENFLVHEIERVLYERSAEWEGEPEQVIEFGDAVVRTRGTRGGWVMRIGIDPASADRRLDDLITQVEGGGRRCMWIVGPSTTPVDLAQQLMARGFERRYQWEGLALTDLSVDIEVNPEVGIEPLSEENAADYAMRCTPSMDPRWHEFLLECARCYLQMPRREVDILVARLNGEVAGYAVLRVERNGIAYLADAFTVPDCRRRGVYSSLVASRLAMARAFDCVAVVTQAQSHSSAPILVKRGFRKLCQMAAYVRLQS